MPPCMDSKSIRKMGKLFRFSQTVLLHPLLKQSQKPYFMSNVKPIDLLQTTSPGAGTLPCEGQRSSSGTAFPPSYSMSICRRFYHTSNPNNLSSKDQTPAAASHSQSHQPETPASVTFGNRPAQKFVKSLEDVQSQRDMSTVGQGSASSQLSSDKLQSHTLKTNLDHALSSNNPEVCTSLDLKVDQLQEMPGRLFKSFIFMALFYEVPVLSTRRVDPSLVKQVFYFDTLAFSKRLERSGFTREQAEGCAECLVEIINTTLDHQGRHMISKPQQEIAVQQLMSEILCVKKDMTLLQKSEFSSLKTETEKMSVELSQVQGHMNDEIVKLKGQFSLDINLERGRAIEAHAENEKKLQQLHNKIETEVANLKTTFEVYRNDVFKYAGGTVLAVGTLMLGVIRLWT